MSTQLQGKKVLFITANTGIERDELLKPLEALREAGATVTHASSEGGTVQTFQQDTEKDRTVESDGKIQGLNASDFDALVIPGGTVNADTLRQDTDAQQLVKAFADAGKVVAAICHGPWLLINAGVIPGKTLTSYPSVSLDLTNAGAAGWVDQEVKQCGANGWTLITSRNPKDIPAFNDAIIKALATA
ncbi:MULTISPECIES: type 1 glutamine amidotransferase domain-containing protein [unclassified Pseudomonas]|uniref:type 1 glutamine amidotransferase domain-containing protein n=1 Tax=unclassified Pseudomonas TaxID=196821 RepID=UPI00177EF808|nr:MULTISPECIES: type 1 glutamine amidotransferase domain-containing protein [unclassified Pseudomonas]MBD8602661.1 type 1 glutamine amidotransferase [Pseudomonas sp. CFBP 8771]MBD8624829.1 type 1 glutamine amidotransferase [Pseudomonas sp. CFBP 13727]MBD8827786.1 type 1 glutamine amidotransferase [Pseudomonas sp. CFBP 13602]